MLKFLKYLIGLIFLAVFLGTGYILVTQGGMPFIWQMFWLGFIIWIWGIIILSRFKEKERVDTGYYRAKDAIYLEHKKQLDRIKIAAISALFSITFFYSSISFIFKDNVLVSLIIMFITFYVSFTLQNKIIEAAEKN